MSKMWNLKPESKQVSQIELMYFKIPPLLWPHDERGAGREGKPSSSSFILNMINFLPYCEQLLWSMGMLNMVLRPKAPAAAVVSIVFITMMEVMTCSLYSL